MKLESKSSATILVDGNRRIVIPELVILDLSDLRTLTQEELLLKLAMEHVRSLPAEPRKGEPERAPGELIIPRTTMVHGENKTPAAPPPNVSPQTATLQLHGTRVLFDQEFYATCVLKAKEIIRQCPDIPDPIDARIMIAAALEKMSLRGEALSEYLNIPTGTVSPRQRSLVEHKIAELKSKSE